MPPKKPVVIGPQPKRLLPPAAATARASTSTTTTTKPTGSAATTNTKFTPKASPKIPSKSPATTGTGTKPIPKSVPKITAKSPTTATNATARRPLAPKVVSLRTTKSLVRKDSATVSPTSTARKNASSSANEARIAAKRNPEFVEKFSPIHAPGILALSESSVFPVCAPSDSATNPKKNASQIKCRIAPDKRGDSASEIVEKNSQKCATGGNEAKVGESVEKIVQEDGKGSAGVKKNAVKKTVRFAWKVDEKGIDNCLEENLEDHVDLENIKLQVSVAMHDFEQIESLVSAGLEVKNHDPNVLVSRQNVENPNYPVNVSMEVKSPNPDVCFSMEEIENPNCAVKVSMKVENPDNANVCGREQIGSVTEDPLEAHDDGDVFEKPISVNENLTHVYATVDGNDGYVSESAQSGGRGNDRVEDEEGKCDDHEFREGEVGSGRAVLRRELEALDRQRRSKTEIYIGGLNKDVNKEDIRSIFKEVGEVVEVRLISSKMGKDKGYAFVRFASAADTEKALGKDPKVEIYGKQCGTAHVDGNDTIFLGNIDKKWRNEDVINLLQKIGIEKIDKVEVMADPNNVHHNHGFAFVEFETNKDAQHAYNKLQKKDGFGKHHNVSVAWAEHLNAPDEEETLKANMKGSLANPIPKGKSVKRVCNPISKEISKEKTKAVQCGVEPNGPRNKGISIRENHETTKGDICSANVELVQLLREQASWRQSQTRLASMDVDYPYFLPGMKRPLASLGKDSLHSDTREYTRACCESSFAIASSRFSGAPKDIG